MKVQGLPPPSRFIFWCTAPFFVATILLMPLLSRPHELTGWIVLFALELLAVFALLGLYDAERFKWCWRIAGGLVFTGYVAYFISMVTAGQWLGDGRRSSMTVINALLGLIVFGYPGFMYAIFGRFTWHPESELDGYNAEFLETGETRPESDVQ